MTIKEYAQLKKGYNLLYKGKILKKYIEKYFFNKNIFFKIN